MRLVDSQLQKAWDIVAKLLVERELDEASADVLLGQFFVRSTLCMLGKQKQGKEYLKTGVIYSDQDAIQAKFMSGLSALLKSTTLDYGDGFKLHDVCDASPAPASSAPPSLLSVQSQESPEYILFENGFHVGDHVVEKSVPDRSIFQLTEVSDKGVLLTEQSALDGPCMKATLPLAVFLKRWSVYRGTMPIKLPPQVHTHDLLAFARGSTASSSNLRRARTRSATSSMCSTQLECACRKIILKVRCDSHH